jgi:pimeloyl-ACP methyl ester carboxylesterase
MPRVESKDGTSIAYEAHGRGSVVVLVDGALAHRAYRGGRALAAELAKTHGVVVYDRRGRGESTDESPYAVRREVEDIEALIDASGGRAGLYGFSSGAVLALHAAAALPDKVTRIAFHEPPFGGDDEASKRESLAFAESMSALLRAGDRDGAVELFLRDMLPPEVLRDLRSSSDWSLLAAVAPTLAHDNAVLGDGSVPVSVARRVLVPALVIDGSESPPFKRAAADALARALPSSERRTLEGVDTLVPPDALAPVLTEFFGRSSK